MHQRTTLFAVVRRYGLVVAAAATVVAVGAYVASGLRPPQYRATAEILLGDRAEEGVFGDVTTVDRTRRRTVEQQRVTSAPVLTAAAERLGSGTTAGDLAGTITTSVDTDADRIEVTATAQDPERAAAVANAVVNEYHAAVSEDIAADARARLAELKPYVKRLQTRLDELSDRAAELNDGYQAQIDTMAGLRPEQRVWTLRDLQNSTPEYDLIDRQLSSTRSSLDEAERETEQLQVDAGLVAIERVDTIAAADVPRRPYSPAPARDAGVAGVLALLCAGAVAWRRLDRTPRRVPFDAVPDRLGVPALGVVPTQRRLRTGNPVARAHEPSLPAAEAFQLVAASLHGPMRAHGITSLLVTSPARREGRTTTVVNLAAAASLDGTRVVIVDADLRSRGLTDMCGAGTMPGLSDAVVGSFDEQWLVDVPLGGQCLARLLPAGTPTHDIAGTLAPHALRDLVDGLRSYADIVIVDGPPLLGRADATQVASVVGGAIVVLGRPMTDDLLASTQARLSFLDVPILGLVRVAASRSNRQQQTQPRLYATSRDEIAVDAPPTAQPPPGRQWLTSREVIPQDH